MKKHILFLTAMFFGSLCNACDNESESGSTDSNKSDFQIACEKTGGVYQTDNRCSCQSVVCDEGIVCHALTLACAKEDNPGEQSGNSGKEDNPGEQPVTPGKEDNPGEQPVNPDSDKSDFQIACEKTGGTFNHNRCVCKDIPCDEGDVCNAVSKACSSSPDALGLCVNGNSICMNGKLYDCVENKWNEKSSGLDCENGCLPDHSACAECLMDACGDGKLKKCEGGKYMSTILCDSKKCSSDGNACEPECEGNETICKDNKLYLCHDGHFVENQDCPAGCDENTKTTCAKECQQNAMLCINKSQEDPVGFIKKCIDNKYDDGTACENGYSCISIKECGECKNGEMRCVNDEVTAVGRMEICDNGKFILLQNCAEGNSCHKDKKSCGACNNAVSVCENHKENAIDPFNGEEMQVDVGDLIKCVDGQFVTEACEDKNSCNGDYSACGECQNDHRTCTNENNLGWVFLCRNGKYIKGRYGFEDKDLSAFQEGKQCTTSCYLNRGRCGECVNETLPYCDYAYVDSEACQLDRESQACKDSQPKIKTLLKHCVDGSFQVKENCGNSAGRYCIQPMKESGCCGYKGVCE